MKPKFKGCKLSWLTGYGFQVRSSKFKVQNSGFDPHTNGSEPKP